MKEYRPVNPLHLMLPSSFCRSRSSLLARDLKPGGVHPFPAVPHLGLVLDLQGPVCRQSHLEGQESLHQNIAEDSAILSFSNLGPPALLEHPADFGPDNFELSVI